MPPGTTSVNPRASFPVQTEERSFEANETEEAIHQDVTELDAFVVTVYQS